MSSIFHIPEIMYIVLNYTTIRSLVTFGHASKQARLYMEKNLSVLLLHVLEPFIANIGITIIHFNIPILMSKH